MGGFVIGIDAGTESFRAGIFDQAGRCLGFGVSPNRTVHRHPGWRSQSPRDWDIALVECIRKALSASRVAPSDVRGIGVDAPVAPWFFWMPAASPCGTLLSGWTSAPSRKPPRSPLQGIPRCAMSVMGTSLPNGFPARRRWVKRNEPQVYAEAATVFEETDWLAFRLTGERTANIDTTTVRWFYKRSAGGMPVSLYRKMGLEDVLQKGLRASWTSERRSAD